MKTTLIALSIVFSASLLLTGCPKPPVPTTTDYEKQLPFGKLALRKITNPADIPDFTVALQDTRNLKTAIDYSLEYLSKSSSQKPFPYGDIATHQQAVDSLRDFRQLLDSGQSAGQINDVLRKRYDVYISVGCDDHGLVRFTGYYTPVIHGSLTPTPKFRYPLYSLPAEHQVTEKGTVAMPNCDRRAIEQGHMLAGKELVYLDDPFMVYVVQVQGSAKIKLPDGTEAIFGFAGTNGYDYKSIRAELLNEGKIDKDKASLQTMIEYFREHPDEITKYTWRNPRFVFFARNTDPWPHGSLNEPVTAFRTVATDKSIFPRACLAFVSTTLPRRDAGGEVVNMPYQAFALDQDTGGGIRAPGRCDIYMGIGGKAAELAGRTVQDGSLYYLFLKPNQTTAAPTPAGGSFTPPPAK